MPPPPQEAWDGAERTVVWNSAAGLAPVPCKHLRVLWAAEGAKARAKNPEADTGSTKTALLALPDPRGAALQATATSRLPRRLLLPPLPSFPLQPQQGRPQGEELTFGLEFTSVEFYFPTVELARGLPWGCLPSLAPGTPQGGRHSKDRRPRPLSLGVALAKHQHKAAVDSLGPVPWSSVPSPAQPCAQH